MTDHRPLTDLLGHARARIATALQTRPLTAAEVAAELSVSAAAARRHLAVLAGDGLVSSDTVRDGSLGRPHERWSLTARGKRLFADRSAEFADELLDHLAATFGRGAVADFLKARAERQADRYAADLAGVTDPVERVEQLADALSADGFAAQVVTGDDGGSLTLLQSHCAIESIAREHPEVCVHETALFKRLLGTKVSRRDTIASGAAACVCHIDLAPTGTATTDHLTQTTASPTTDHRRP